MKGKNDVLTIKNHLVEAEAQSLFGQLTLERWNSKFDTMNKVLEMYIDGSCKKLKMINPGSNQFGIMIKNRSKDYIEILFVRGKKEDLTLFNSLRHVHEVNNH